jgi:hypothetical protein
MADQQPHDGTLAATPGSLTSRPQVRRRGESANEANPPAGVEEPGSGEGPFDGKTTIGKACDRSQSADAASGAGAPAQKHSCAYKRDRSQSPSRPWLAAASSNREIIPRERSQFQFPCDCFNLQPQLGLRRLCAIAA